MVVFGAGDQARAHLALFAALWPGLHRTVVLRRDPSSPLPAELAEQVILSSDPGVAGALAAADVVVTATPATEPLFSADALRPGAALVLLGSSRPDMCEAPLALMREAHVVVDSREACLRDAGEIIQAGLKGEDLTELGTLLDGGDEEWNGKRGAGSTTVFKSVGLGMQDLAINRLVLAKAEEKGVGTVV